MTVDATLDLFKVEKILMDIGNELKEELAPDSKPEVHVNSLNNQSHKSELIASKVRRRAKMKLDEIGMKNHKRETRRFQKP